MVPLLNWIWTIISCNKMLNFIRLSNVHVEEGRGNEGSPFSFPQLLSSLSGSSVHWIPQARVGSHFLLQGILPTQELNSRLLRFRHILYRLSHQTAHQSKLGRFITTGHEQKIEAKSKPPKWAEQNQVLRRDTGDVGSERFPEGGEALPGTGWDCPM